jgi:hypothetical protein
VSHHPGSDNSLLLSSSSGAATGWFLITYRDKERPNSEVRVAPLTDPTRQTVRLFVVLFTSLFLVLIVFFINVCAVLLSHTTAGAAAA